jgi:putative endopeptidase
MKYTNTVSFALLSFFLSACDNTPGPSQTSMETASPEVAQSAPVYGAWGVDLGARDESVNPGDDFFQYANGNWLATHEIPEERVTYGVMLIIHERAQERVKSIIEELGAEGGIKGSPEQKVGDFYASWMDVETVNDLGIRPLQADLDRIAQIDDVADLTAEFGRLHYVNGISPISAGLGIDPMNPDRYNYNIGLGGMGLPDRDYYLDGTEQFKNIRKAYRTHIARMLDFAGVEGSGEKAGQILALETRIAGYQWIRADRRDRDKTFNPTSVAQLKVDYGNFNWDLFISSANVHDLGEVNVRHPDTISPLIALINGEPIELWKTYLTYHSISNNASLLSEEIDDANFEFWGKVLTHL